MKSRRNHKKNLIVSYKSLSEELKEVFKEQYPDGYSDFLQRFEKPNGDVIFVAPMETEDTVYMVKFDVKIDTTYADDDMDKDFYDEEVEKADSEFAPLQEALDKEEENPSHTERVVRHGNYDDELDTGKKKSPIAHGSLSALGEELQEAFSDDGGDSYDDYNDDKDDDEDEFDPDEPTDEELMDIDSEIFANAEIPPEELARSRKGRQQAQEGPSEEEPRTYQCRAGRSQEEGSP